MLEQLAKGPVDSLHFLRIGIHFQDDNPLVRRRRVGSDIRKSLIVGDQHSTQLSGLAKDFGILGAAQVQLLNAVDLESLFPHKADCDREHVLVSQEPSHE